MATITVGTDFGINETPNNAKFFAQGKSLTISGLTVENFASGVVLIKSDADSGSSGALEATDPPGQLWIDARGDLWVQEQAGPVKLYRYDMGWESRRYFVQPRSGSGLTNQPYRALTVALNSQFEDFDRGLEDTDSTGVTVEMNITKMLTTQNGRYNGILQDTGASTFARWSGRGGTILHDVSFNSSTFDYDRDMKNNIRMFFIDNIPTVYERHYYSTDFGANEDKHLGWVMAPTSGTSVVSDGTFASNGFLNKVQRYAWGYGLYLRGERFRGPLVPA